MRLQLIALVLTVFLVGCASAPPEQPPRYIPQKVNVAVPVSCIKESDIPVEPLYELDKAAVSGSVDDKGTLALKEIEQRRAWQREAKAILKSCASVPTK